MPRSTPRPPQIEDARPYLEGVAKNLATKLYGPEGPPWGTPLTAIEDLLLQLREVLTEELLAQLLRRQADAAPPPVCPSCQRALDPGEPDPRLLTTRLGTAEWSEPQAHCRSCRRAFFPSVPESGPRS